MEIPVPPELKSTDKNSDDSEDLGGNSLLL